MSSLLRPLPYPWYKVGQPTFQDKIQELNTDFAKIYITPRPPRAPVAKVPLPVLKELEHQARQNISTLNFTAAFAKTSSSCNASLEKCQHSIKSTVKKIKSQIQKGANPEKAAKRGYEEVAEYMDFWNKTVLVQHRALTCLSKSLAHILQRELYSMANTGLLRREAEMTLLHPQLGETRRQELRNSSFWGSSLFESQLVKEGEDFLLKKGTSKDSQGFAPYQNKPFRGPHKKRGSYRKRPYGGNTSQSSNQSFPSGRGKPNFRSSRGRFRPHNRGRGRGNPPSQWLLQSLTQSTSRRSHPFFQERLANKQMFSKRVKHYHQWLCSAIPFKAKLDQISSDSVRVQGPTKRPSLAHLYPVSPVKERYRKGGKCKISRVLQSPVSSTQASPYVEASPRPKQAQHFSTRRKVQNGNSRVHPDFPDSRGMGFVDRSVRRLPTHPHPPNLKEIPKVLLQGSGVPVHLPPVRAGHSPPGLYNNCKGSETNGPLKRTQNSPIPGRLADQVPVSGGSPSEHTDSGRPNPVLGVDNKSGKIRTETYSGVFVRGLRIPPRFSPCKTHSRDGSNFRIWSYDSSQNVFWLQDVWCLIGLLASTEKMVPEGRLHMRPFQFHLKEHWRYPQSLDNLLPWTEAIAAHLDWWQNPSNVMKGSDLHPKDHSIQLFTDASNEGWGAHLDQNSTGGLWSDREKRLHINVLQLKAVSLALRDFKDQCQNQTVLVATDNSTVVAYINKQGGTHSAEMCALLWKIMTWCHHYHIILKARHIPGCLNVMADLLSRSNQVQSTEWSLHPQVFKQIRQKWFTPHVDLFATHLNHKLPLYVSPIPDPRAWDIDALSINWTNLTAYAYPPTALLHKVIQKIRQCHCLIILIAPGWPGMPWFWDLVQLSTEIPLQLPVSTTLLKQSHKYVFHNNPQQPEPPRLVSRSGQLQEQGFSVEVAERIALSGHQQGPSISQSGPFLKNGAEKIRWISPLHLWNKSQIFSCTCTKT